MSNIFKVADAFLRKDNLNARQLQYLCYYYKGWSLALYDADYLEDYNFYVSEIGPICEELLKEYGSAEDVKYAPEHKDLELNNLERQLVENVWATYGELTTYELMMNIKEEPPYLLARVGNIYEEDLIDENIRVEHMEIYFNSLKNGETLPVEKYYPPYRTNTVNKGRVRRNKKTI